MGSQAPAPAYRPVTDRVHWYVAEVAARVVAGSGVPGDRFHLGKIIMQCFQDAPDFVMQIEGATDEHVTFGRALRRSIQCAACYRGLGLQRGDVVAIMAPNYLDVSVPLYAALFLGVIVSPMDRTFGVNEIRGTLENNAPRLVFCESRRAPDVQLALNDLELNCQIVTFDKGDYLCSFDDFLEAYGDDAEPEDFKPADFDPEDTIAFLIPTSGTTGLPKSAAATHKNFLISGPYMWCKSTKFPTPVEVVLVPSPMQWLTALVTFVMSPILRYTRLMTAGDASPEWMYRVIQQYKPGFTIISPTMLTGLLKERGRCDFSSFESILLGGSAVPEQLIADLKALSPRTEVYNAYGMTEVTGVAFLTDLPPPGSCGRPMPYLDYRLVDPETQQNITEAGKPGELWLAGPSIIKEYYNNSAATAEAFAKDRWFRTGDLFYRDEQWNFYFVDRLKLLLKYKGYQISPVEIEATLSLHPAVLEAAVSARPSPECGDLLVACVVRRPHHAVSAQEIKDFIRERLSDPKQLRGGVVFLDSLPTTASTKLHRRRLKEIVLAANPE